MSEGGRYVYGMKLRGFAPLCQPMAGLLGYTEDPTGVYYNLLAYDRPLTEEELRDYELVPIQSVK